MDAFLLQRQTLDRLRLFAYNRLLAGVNTMHLVQKALTFDDVLLVPAYSEVLPRDTILQSQFTREIQLNIPLVSAAMDTVTEARLAIAMAQEGGIGVIHKNIRIERQAQEVSRLYRHEFRIDVEQVAVSTTKT